MEIRGRQGFGSVGAPSSATAEGSVPAQATTQQSCRGHAMPRGERLPPRNTEGTKTPLLATAHGPCARTAQQSRAQSQNRRCGSWGHTLQPARRPGTPSLSMLWPLTSHPSVKEAQAAQAQTSNKALQRTPWQAPQPDDCPADRHSTRNPRNEKQSRQDDKTDPACPHSSTLTRHSAQHTAQRKQQPQTQADMMSG